MHERTSTQPLIAAIDFYRLIRGQIEHEDNLITQRLSWFLASQAFLFSAFAIVLNAPLQSRFGDRIQLVFFRFIPVIAIAVGLLIWLAVWAGILAMRRLRGMLYERPDLTDFPLIQGRLHTRWMGLAAPVFLPPLFAAVWGALLFVG